MLTIYADGEGDRGALGISRLVDFLNNEGHCTRLGARFGKGPVGDILRAEYYATGLFPHGRWDKEKGLANVAWNEPLKATGSSSRWRNAGSAVIEALSRSVFPQSRQLSRHRA